MRFPSFRGHPDQLGRRSAGEDALIGSKRKSYTPKFRVEAARLVIDTGRTIVEVAREIGVKNSEEIGTMRCCPPLPSAMVILR